MKCDYPACGNAREEGELYCIAHNRKYTAFPNREEKISKLQIFKGKLSGQWIMLMPGRTTPNGYEPVNMEFLDIKAYRQWLRLFNKGWRVRRTA